MYKKRQGIGSWIATILLTLYCLIAIVLIGNMVISSFKTKQDLLFNTFGFPTKISFENYRQVLVKDTLYKNFFNSIILTTLSIASLIFFSSMTAYGLSRYRFKGRQALEMYFLLGLMFPIQIAILPLFIIMRTLKLTNTFLGMIILYTANMSFSLFIFTQFFKELPAALHESAVIDGASEVTIFLRIMVPISKPVIFTVMTVSFVQIWNDFYLPLVFLAKRSLHTLTLAIYQYLANFLAYWNYVFAAATLSLIPVIIVFVVFSDQIISGLASGSIKE
ncbi:MAG: carbohydrate ABC transporter permease [Sphaerochaetaceae bacterium]|jgi:raffinose/stachyose/melibiose transport system permease protein|nr:carbohydrate ABC transporter permease [Sphaerochaetaceae bacterium]HHU87776.1 carbohydrate ABC transporter permease [Spirochaetales bacterium]